MLALHELRSYKGEERVWVGKYRDLSNLPHWHDDCELIYATKGSAVVTVEHERCDLEEGDAAFVSSREVHHIEGDDGSVLAFVLFDHRLIKDILARFRLSSHKLTATHGLPEIYDVIDRELTEASPLYAMSVANRVQRMMIDVFSTESVVTARDDESYHEKNYKRLLADIDKRFADYDLSMAASFLSLSESYFSAFFKKMSGMTFSRYLNLVKTEKAVEAIKSGEKLSVTDIAIRCGFDTIRNFNRVFRSITGFSPKKLPRSYDVLAMHPTYGVEESRDPTDERSVLITDDEKEEEENGG